MLCNITGRLGHGDEAYRRLPTLIESLKEEKVVQASCLGAHTAALTGCCNTTKIYKNLFDQS